MPWFYKNAISNQAVKAKSDKIMKRALRDAHRRIKKHELIDGHDLNLYLPIIDTRFVHIEADIKDATQVLNYTRVRAEKLAETRRLIAFFNQDYDELNRLSQIVSKKAADAGRIDDFKHEKLSFIDITKLKEMFDELMRRGK